MRTIDGIDCIGQDRRVDLARLDLNLLVALDALLTERNVTRAAARMYVGQPAMSATLNRLRRQFDDPLLVRDGRHLVTTPVADSLAEPLRRALAEVGNVLERHDLFRSATAQRTFSIMATDYVTLIFLPALLSRLAEEAPNIKLNIYPVSSDAADRLRRREIDLVIHPLEVFAEPDRFERVGLFRDRYVIAVDDANADVGDAISLAEFLAQPYLATLVGQRPSYAEVQLDAAGIQVQREIVTNCTLAPWLIPGTRYTTLLPEHLAEFAASKIGLRLLEPPIPLQPVTEAMMWSGRNTHDAAHRWLRRTVSRLVHDFDLSNWDWTLGPR